MVGPEARSPEKEIKKLGALWIMWITGITPDVEHCLHCKPMLWWLENQPGKPPQFAFKGFPASGQVVLSKARVIVLCSQCSMPDDLPSPLPNS